MAEIRPFPAHQRVAMIRRLAAQMASYNSASGEKLLAARLKKHAAGLIAKGVPEDVVRDDVASFHGAVRAELWRLVMTRGGAA